MSTAAFAIVLGPLAFSHFPSWTDLVVTPMMFYGNITSRVHFTHRTDDGISYSGMYPLDTNTLTGPPRTPAMRLFKSYLKTVLSNPESRKIFYFLMLNLSYMLIQMLYGVWTNSLGLISDGTFYVACCCAIRVKLNTLV